MRLEETGIPTAEQVEAILPPERRRRKGPYAVFECFQRIPCDPCYWSCPQKAVKEFRDINDLPEVDLDKCTGCGTCVARCPGLAIFVVDEYYDESRALIRLPHEFVPLPLKGDFVDLLDRNGDVAGRGEVVMVAGRKKGDTPVVSVKVDRELCNVVRAIRVGGDPS